MNGSGPPGNKGLQLILPDFNYHSQGTLGQASWNSLTRAQSVPQSEGPRTDQGKRELGTGTWEDEGMGCARYFVILEAPSRLVPVGATGRVSLASSL